MRGSYRSDWEAGLFTPTHLLKLVDFVLNDIFFGLFKMANNV